MIDFFYKNESIYIDLNLGHQTFWLKITVINDC